MPVRKHGNTWRIGSGTADYKSKEDADKAYKAYLAKKHSGKIAKKIKERLGKDK